MIEKRKKILLVSPDFPYPANYGGRVDVYSRLNTLKKLDYIVDLVYTSTDIFDDLRIEDKLHIQTLVRNVYFAHKCLKLNQILSGIPFQVKSRSSLSNIILSEEYDILILEGEYVSSILENKTLRVNSTFLRINNIEYNFFFQQSKASFPSISSLYFFLESIKFYFYSKKVMLKAKNLLFVNFEEKKKVEVKFGNLLNCYTLLSHFDVNKFKTRTLSGFKVLFVGSLSLSSNLDGIMWYVKKVHPLLVKEIENYNLVIAGSTDNKTDLSKIKFLGSIEKVQILLNLDDLENVYEGAALFINPVLKGAGIKVKTINCIQNGLPLVSTSVGVEGIGLMNGKDVLIANDNISFSESIKILLLDKSKAMNIVKNSQNYLRSINHEQMLKDILQKRIQ